MACCLAGQVLHNVFQFQMDSYVGFMVLNTEGKQLGTILEVGGTKFQTYFKTSKTLSDDRPTDRDADVTLQPGSGRRETSD